MPKQYADELGSLRDQQAMSPPTKQMTYDIWGVPSVDRRSPNTEAFTEKPAGKNKGAGGKKKKPTQGPSKLAEIRRGALPVGFDPREGLGFSKLGANNMVARALEARSLPGSGLPVTDRPSSLATEWSTLSAPPSQQNLAQNPLSLNPFDNSLSPEILGASNAYREDNKGQAQRNDLTMLGLMALAGELPGLLGQGVEAGVGANVGARQNLALPDPGEVVPLPGHHPGGALMRPPPRMGMNPDVLPPLEQTQATRISPIIDTNQVRPLPRGDTVFEAANNIPTEVKLNNINRYPKQVMPDLSAQWPAAVQRDNVLSQVRSLNQRPPINMSMSDIGQGATTKGMTQTLDEALPLYQQSGVDLTAMDQVPGGPMMQNQPVNFGVNMRPPIQQQGPAQTQVLPTQLQPPTLPGMNTIQQPPPFSNMTQLEPTATMRAPDLLSQATSQAEQQANMMRQQLAQMEQTHGAKSLLNFNQMSSEEQLAALMAALGLGAGGAAGGAALYNSMQPPPRQRHPIQAVPLPRAIQR